MTKRWKDTIQVAALSLPLWACALMENTPAQPMPMQNPPVLDSGFASNNSKQPAREPWQPMLMSTEATLPQPAGLIQPALPVQGDFNQAPGGYPSVLPYVQPQPETQYGQTSLPPAEALQPLESEAGTEYLTARPPVIFRPAVPMWDAHGQPILRPSVWLADTVGTEILPTPGNADHIPGLPSGLLEAGRTPPIEELDLESILAGNEAVEGVWSSANAAQPAGGFWPRGRRALSNLMRPKKVLPRGYDIGVGRERLPFALSEIDSSQPLNNLRLRFDSAYDWEFPDRAEVLWSKAGGPGPAITDPSVDYQAIRMLTEIAGPRFSASTEIPLIFLNPTVLGNTAGLGDMAVTTKTVMIDGETWQLTQILRTQMNTGTAKAGRGSGHVSMEPGLIARCKWRPDTYLHSELKFQFPLGGSPGFAGEVLRYGFGVAHVYYETDTFAVIPTLEFIGWSVLSGGKTIDAFGITQTIDGENIFNIHPGVRLVNDSAGDFGMFEVGLSGGMSVTESHWYSELLRLDLRWSF